jgi:HEAT repeat protein
VKNTVDTQIKTVLLSLALCQLLTVGCSRKQDMIQGRPVAAWVAEVEIGGFPDQKNPALDVLNSAGPEILPQLVHLLRDTSTTQQARAAYAINGICYQHPEAPEVRAAVSALKAAATSKNSEVRIYSIQALGAIGKAASSAIPDLILLTKDGNTSVRMCAVESLGRIGADSPESVSALMAAMSDTSSDVRITATNALGIVQNVHK